jgi:GSH-dependent disulfide-bond oxidoreductase
MAIELFTWTTPNGVKPLIMLEELGAPYHVTAVNIGRGEQFAEEFVRINPNSKVPALVDDGVRIFESGAILIHLAERAKKFLPESGAARSDVMEWLFFQVGGIGPMFGQLGHFRSAKREDTYALDRYQKETERLAQVIERRLENVPYLGGSEYSIADMASIGWVRALRDRFEFDMSKYPSTNKWIDTVIARPAVERAFAWKP